MKKIFLRMAVFALFFGVIFIGCKQPGGQHSKPEIIGIEVTKTPDKMIYDLGEELDTTGMIVTAVYDNASTSVVDNSYITAEGLPSQETGQIPVTIVYQEKWEDTFYVEVYDSRLPTLEGAISITPESGTATITDFTAAYAPTQKEQDDGVRVNFQWNKNDSPIEGETDETFTPNEAGTYTVTVEAEGYNSITSELITVEAFIAVSDIAGVPQEVFTTESIDLSTASVMPQDASFQDIEWIDFDAGTTGATLNGTSIETAANGGIISITAIVRNGEGKDQNFSKVFTVTVKKITEVTNDADSGKGSLREALDNVQDEDVIRFAATVNEIQLESQLSVNRSARFRIEGNVLLNGTAREGVVLTSSGVERFLHLGDFVEAHISGMHFKDSEAMTAALSVIGKVTLESCIFSGNRNTHADAAGGAIYSEGNLTVRGCTFYGNSTAATYSGGGSAIYARNYSSLNLTGNVFYGNTGLGPIVFVQNNTSNIVFSNGYNIVDVRFGTSGNNSSAGWTEGVAGDTFIDDMPHISSITFRPLMGSGSQMPIIPALPADYPVLDFYGKPISNGAAPGAVQYAAQGYYVGVKVNDSTFGSACITSSSPSANDDGLYTGQVSVQAVANEGFFFSHWEQDGVEVSEAAEWSFNPDKHTNIQAVFIRMPLVVDKESDGTGSEITVGTLRHALANVQNDEIIYFAAGVYEIQLESQLLVNRSVRFRIEGNVLPDGTGRQGVVLTRNKLITWGNTQNLLTLSNSGIEAHISGIHFKDSEIYRPMVDTVGTATIESCIFSGNRNTSTSALGGAIRNSNGNLTVRGSTFYGNSTAATAVTAGGAAIYTNGDSGSLTLTGNIFYGNTGSNPVVCVSTGAAAVSSGGYNVVDVPFGTDSTQAGWEGASTDKSIGTDFANLPISPASFRLLSGSAALNVLVTLPAEYPSLDFYGKPISNGAAAGAVQDAAQGSGYYIRLTANNSELGTVSITPAATNPADGLYTGQVTVQAAATQDGSFSHWLQNGTVISGQDDERTFTPNQHTDIQAVFVRVFAVDSDNGAADSWNIPGTLRHALANVQNGDIIRFASGVNNIQLSGQLSLTRSVRFRIEGNVLPDGTTGRQGVVVTSSGQDGLLRLAASGIEAHISGIHFKDSVRTTANWPGVNISSGATVTIESCVFSGNRIEVADSANGGAISNSGNLTVRGCTFYKNSTISTVSPAAAINNSGTLQLTGNVFYENTSDGANYHVVRSTSSSVMNSSGYNVVDVPFGTASGYGSGALSGWAAGTAGDAEFKDITGFSDNTTLPFINTADFVPLEALRGHIPANQADTMPALDFNGQPRTWPGAPGAVR